jgi:hypothetical protein
MTQRARIRVFYESFLNAIYGFVLVIGFQQFVSLPVNPRPFVYVLLGAAYVTVLHYWLVFVASTEDTFGLILSSANPTDSIRMAWFWTELIFATAMLVPMMGLFTSLTNVPKFGGGLLIIAMLSLGWDLWAFLVQRYHKLHTGKPVGSVGTTQLLLRWIGLDLVFVVVMVLLVAVRSRAGHVADAVVAWSLLAICTAGAVLNTAVITPNLFLDGDVTSPAEEAPQSMPPRSHRDGGVWRS